MFGLAIAKSRQAESLSSSPIYYNPCDRHWVLEQLTEIKNDFLYYYYVEWKQWYDNPYNLEVGLIFVRP